MGRWHKAGRWAAWRVAAPMAVLLFLAACVTTAGRGGQTSVSPADLAWLDRLTFGVDSRMLSNFQAGGRDAYLAAQLTPPGEALPPEVAAAISRLTTAGRSLTDTYAFVQAEEARIAALPNDEAKSESRNALRRAGHDAATEAKSRLLMRALYGQDSLNQQLVWFWLNHFSVFEGKARIGFWLADYEAHAIRAHALGHFRDLVLATAQHPAMLEYLDNAQNAQGHINENYARELLELHTLGVNGGYTQSDVEALAHVLTGFGLRGAQQPKGNPRLGKLPRTDGVFLFNPGRHDYGPKRLFSQPLRSRGYDELIEAVDRIVKQPACAEFIVRKLAVYFVGDDPPPALVARGVATFRRTDGDIREVLRTLLTAPEFPALLGHKYKDPMHFVTSAYRLAYDGRAVTDTKPLQEALRTLDQGLFGRQTPDGYPLTSGAYTSSGQLAKRIEVARAIGAGALAAVPVAISRVAGKSPGTGPGSDRSIASTASAANGGFAQLSNRLYFQVIEPRLTAQTRHTLGEARSAQEWNALLLASPEFNYY